jgi:uncharacterized membrane protein YphA (DoxX/SURF4 family)
VTDTKKCCCIAGVLLVALRLSIGWQFLYEGLWKLHTLKTPTPWSAEGYLKNAQGPFRNFFRGLTGDPNDLNWLDREKVEKKWDDWAARFAAHYQLNDQQKAELIRLLDGPKDFRVNLPALPDGVQIPANLAKIVQYDAKSKQLICSGEWRMLARERDALLALAKVEQGDSEDRRKSVTAYHNAVTSLYNRATDPRSFGIKDRLGVVVVGNLAATDPSVTERTFALFGDPPRDLKVYQEKIAKYEADLAKANANSAMNFPRDHLQKQWNELQTLRGKLVGPVKALEAELKESAQKLLSAEQLARGPVRLPSTPMDRINLQTMWGLTILGVLLLVGLFTRLASLGGAVMLTLFYLAMPPWPGVPEAPGPEHSFIVNKNFIEIVALLAIATLPTGDWFGLDSLITRYRQRRKQCLSGATTPCTPAAGRTSSPVTSGGG